MVIIIYIYIYTQYFLYFSTTGCHSQTGRAVAQNASSKCQWSGHRAVIWYCRRCSRQDWGLRRLWGSTEAAVTWSWYHNRTSTWNNPAVRLHLSPCERRGMQGNNGNGQRLRWGRQMPYRTHVLPNIRIQAQRRLLIMLAGSDREPDVSAAAERVQRGGCCAATRPLNP